MATHKGRLSLTLLSLLLVAGAAAAQDPKELPSANVAPDAQEEGEGVRGRFERDRDRRGGSELLTRENPEGRRQWKLQWYGGPWSQEYRRFLMDVARQHGSRYAAKMPKPGLNTEMVAATGTNWSNVGPTDGGISYNVNEGGVATKNLSEVDSGRPNQIVPHPTDGNTLFLVTSGGGLWKTTDGGASWTSLTDTLGTLALGSLALDPTNPNIMYLGLGDIEEENFGGAGIGIVKSTDGGLTWGAPIALGTSDSVTSTLVPPTASNIVLVGTNKGLFRSTDSGATYSAVTTPSGLPTTVRDITWISGSNFVLTMGNNFEYGGGGGGATILVSSDSGATWHVPTGLGSTTTLRRFSLGVAPSNRNIIYGLASNTSGDTYDIFKSSDGGNTWSRLNVAGITYTNPIYDAAQGDDRRTVGTLLGGQGGYNQIAVVDPTNPNVAYFGGNLNLIKTSNGGSAFTLISDWDADYSLPYTHADNHCAAFDKNGNLWVGHDGGVGKTANGGSTWSSTANRGLSTHLIYSVGSTLANRSVIIGGFQDNGTRVRQGSTGNFQEKIYGDGFGALAHPVNGSLLLGSVYNTRILKSTDGGTTFAAAYTGITEAGGNTAPFNTQIIPWAGDATGNTVYTFVNAKVYKSTNFAGSWSALGTSGLPTRIRNFGVAKSNGSVMGLVSESSIGAKNNPGSVYLSSNGGSSWSLAAGTLPSNGGSLSNISFSPANSSVIYVAAVAASATSGHLWKSTNGGTSWSRLDTGAGFPAGVPVNTVVEDPGDSNTLYAGTHLGLYKSTDGGTNWTRFGTGLPLVAVTDVYVAPDSSLVRVATFGRGFWELTPSTVQNPPTITTQPQPVTVSAGQTATFTVAASGTAPFTYQWRKNGAAITGATASSYTTPATTLSDSGSTFSVVVTNSLGSATSTNATLTVSTSTVFYEVEANNTIATANVVANTFTSIQGYLPTVSDVDTFALTLAPNQKITIAMTGPSGLDWDLALKDSAGVNLASSAGSTTTENLSWTNGATTKTVYPQVIVWNTSTGSTTPYNLALTYGGGDSTAPTVTASETGTAGTITLSATASDNTGGSGMAKVEFLVDGVLKGTDTTSPYSMTLNSIGNLSDGSHSLVAKAYDVAGNSAPSTAVSFTINNSLSQNEVESNDTYTTANTVLTSGTTVTGYISSTTDTDYYKVTLAPGATLTATLTPPSTSDFDLYIYSSTGTGLLASSELGTGQVDSASVTNTGTSAITRYIQVKYWAGASTTQSYKLKLTF